MGYLYFRPVFKKDKLKLFHQLSQRDLVPPVFEDEKEKKIPFEI